MTLFAIVSVPVFALYQTLAVQECSIDSAPSSSDNRLITLSMNNCTDVKYFSASESPDYGKSSGPKIDITNVANDNSYADVKVTYPDGQPGAIASPYSVANSQKTIKVLAVNFAYEDDSGEIAGKAAYQTPTWLNRLLFNSSTNGFDGYFKNSSVNDYLFQSTAGRVKLSGEAYPSTVRLSLEKYRGMLARGETYSLDADILDAIEEQNPGYLASKDFDFLLSVSSDTYSVDRTNYIHTSPKVSGGSYGSIKRSLTYAIPTDLASSVLGGTMEEVRVSTDSKTVVTRYNPNTVEGVWLESDTNKSGKNYFTGGSIDTSSNTRFRKITLGSVLPTANERVVVRYKASLGTSEDQTLDSRIIGSEWYPHFTHELMHDLSSVPGFSLTDRQFLGDLYMRPSNVVSFDLMASGNLSGLHPQTKQSYNEPSLLSASNRVLMGHQQPLTFGFGKNTSSTCRIYRSEFGNAADSDRTTLIKVPLQAEGDPGLETRIGSSNTVAQQYVGSEYLLMEWRSKTDALENDMHNFDRLLSSEGLVIYHMIEADPFKATGTYSDIVRIVDATPPNNSFTEGYSDTADSPVTFGPQSGVMSYSAGDFWQEKVTSAATHSFQQLLSTGTGSKTLYVKFANENGDIVGTQQLVVNLAKDESPSDRLPQLSFDTANGTTISTTKTIKANYTAPNGAKGLRFYVDGEMKIDRVQPSISATSESYFVRAIDLKAGTHELKAVLYDGALNKVSKTVTFVIPADKGDETPPTVSITSPAGSSALSSNVTIAADVTDNNQITKVETYVDGSLRSVDTTSPYSYMWNTSGVSNGAHTISVKAYDVAGNSTTANKDVQVANVDTSAPTVPTGLRASVTESQAELNWNSSSDDSTTITYDVYRNSTKITSTVATSYTDSGLSSGTKYSYYVIAKDASGNKSEQSALISITTSPSAPKSVSATAATSSQILVAWEYNTDISGSALYDVYRDGALIASVSSNSYADTGLKASTTYQYYVVVKDSSGTVSKPSSTVQAKTFATQVQQYGSLKGKVERGNGDPVAGATVTIKGNGITRSTKTSKTGAYSFSNVKIGIYTLTIKKLNFNTKTLQVTVAPNTTLTKNVTVYRKQ